MSETNKINTYANIKQSSNSDLRLPPRQIVAEKDEQVSTLNQTVINLSIKVDLSNKDGFQLYIDGKLLREGSSNDYTFTSIQADNSSSQITLTDSLPAGLNIIAQKLGVDKEIAPSLSNLQAELARRKVYANYITNGTFEYLGTIGWNLYNDGAVAVPVDGTGGTVNANVTFAITQINPLRGANSAVLSKDAANRRGHGVSTDFQIDLADCNKMLSVRLDVRGSANYQAGFAKLFVYDRTNMGSPISCVPIEIPSTGQAVAFFPSTDSTQYRLILHIASNDALAWTLAIDDVQVGQPDLIFGYPGSDWINSGPTIITAVTTSPTKGAVATDQMWWRRVGDSMEIRMVLRMTSTGGSAGSGDYLFQIPTGYSIDLDKVKASTPTGSNIIVTSDGAVGYFDIQDQFNNEHSSGITSVYDSTKVRFIGDTATASVSYPDVMGSTHIPLNHSSDISYHALMTVPILGWDSSIQLASSKVEYAFNSDTSNGDNTSAFAYGAGGASIGTYTTTERQKRVRFATPIQQTDHVFLEIQENGNWERASDHELNPQSQGSIRYGIRVKPVAGSPTDYDVFFGDGGGIPGATYTGSGLAWSNFISLKWRLVKSANALAVEADSIGAKLIGSAYINTAASHTNTAGATLAPVNTAGGGTPTIESNPGPGALSSASVNTPRIKVSGLLSGTYRVTMAVTGGAGSANASLAIWDGTNLSGFCGFDGASNKRNICIGYFRYVGSSDITYELYAANDSNTTTVYATALTGNDSWKVHFSIERVGN